MELRKVTYRMYPNQKQAALLDDLLRLHCRLYNTALEERMRVYREEERSLRLHEQERVVTQWREQTPALAAMNAQSLQVTLKRVDLAFQAFFRRNKAGEAKPGFPRFKSVNRFPGWGYKTHGDGWRLNAGGNRMRHGCVRISGVGNVKLRGQARSEGEPRTCEILHKQGKWYLSVTVGCEPVRDHGDRAMALDWGLENFATMVDTNGHATTFPNPRFTNRAKRQRLRELHQAVSRKKNMRSHRRRCAIEALGRECARIARRRVNFMHQWSTLLISLCALIATEKLAVKNMTAGSGAYKKGLNRSILDLSPAYFLACLRYKAAEAGIEYCETPTRQLKPSQTCHRCGMQKKKPLSERWHRCECGASCSRDENAARVMLNWALTGSANGQELTGVAGSGRSLAALNRETHAVMA